jgi:hypothetical protein
MLPFLATLLILASLFISAASVPLPPRSDDVLIAGSIEAYVLDRSEILHLRVDSIGINKLSSGIDGGVYRSTWEVTLRFKADYARPEEDPYLAGMLKCLTDLKAVADSDWIQWAQDEIDTRRSEVWDLISYAQELEEQVTAHAEIDGAGRVVPETVKLEVEGVDGAHTSADLLKAVPRPGLYEAAGYKYLRDTLEDPVEPGTGKQDPFTAGGQVGTAAPPKETGQTGGKPGTTPATVPVQPVPPAIKPTTRKPAPTVGAAGSNRANLILWATGLIAFLLLILIASEIYNQRRKRSTGRL